MKLGNLAVIVGAGVGGLSAAAALAPSFDRVIILDRDILPTGPSPRMGVGQGVHTHQLLKAGEDSLEALLPGIRASLIAIGAVKMRVGADIKMVDAGGVLPACDAGFDTLALSRPALEAVLRAAVAELPNVEIRTEVGVKRFVVVDGVCVGVEGEDGMELRADLMVDASGMNAPLAEQLFEEGHARFEREVLKINVAYTTGRFRRSEPFRGERKGFFLLPAPPSVCFGLMLPIEDDQWIVSLGGRGSQIPPRDLTAFRDYARRLAEPDIWDRIKNAEPVGELRTFRKVFSTRRRFDIASKWPNRLLVIGDAMSNVNPTYGQGMTVAAKEAEALASMLRMRRVSGEALNGLTPAYFHAAAEIAQRAWSLAANSDYNYPETEGERPATFAASRQRAGILRRLAQEDDAFRIVRYRLGHMVDTEKALAEGPLAARLFEALQDHSRVNA